jgi:hypothetical protein
VRRILIITLCLGLVIWLWWRSGLSESDFSEGVWPRPQSPSQGVDDEFSEPVSEPVSQAEPVDGSEELMAELVEIRAEVVETGQFRAPASVSVSQPAPVDSGKELMAELVEIHPEVVQERPVTEPVSELVSQAQREDAPLDMAGDSGEQLMAELAQIRAEVVGRVERRPLFVMAEQRHVPYSQLFFMTKQELFEAVLEAEGLPPHDVMPSLQSAERIKEIAAEALHLHEEMEAEEAAHRANGKTA